MNATDKIKSGRFRAIIMLVVVFIVGALAGSGGTLFALSRYVKASFQRNWEDPNRSDGMGDAMIRNFEKKLDDLDLTPTEKAAVSEELDKTRKEFHDLRGEVGPRIRAMVAKSDAGIRSVLPPEKIEDYEAISRKHLSPWGLAPKTTTKSN